MRSTTWRRPRHLSRRPSAVDSSTTRYILLLPHPNSLAVHIRADSEASFSVWLRVGARLLHLRLPLGVRSLRRALGEGAAGGAPVGSPRGTSSPSHAPSPRLQEEHVDECGGDVCLPLDDLLPSSSPHGPSPRQVLLPLHRESPLSKTSCRLESST